MKTINLFNSKLQISSYIIPILLSSVLFYFLQYYVISYLIISAYISLFIHELGHFLGAKVFKIKATKIYLGTTGGFTLFHKNVSFFQDFVISISGSLLNALAFLILLIVSKFFHIDYLFVKMLMYVNFVFIAELLPIMPLDGGRLIRVFYGNFMKDSFLEATLKSYVFGFSFCITSIFLALFLPISFISMMIYQILFLTLLFISYRSYLEFTKHA